jgi:hypothetical protein
VLQAGERKSGNTGQRTGSGTKHGESRKQTAGEGLTLSLRKQSKGQDRGMQVIPLMPERIRKWSRNKVKE